MYNLSQNLTREVGAVSGVDINLQFHYVPLTLIATGALYLLEGFAKALTASYVSGAAVFLALCLWTHVLAHVFGAKKEFKQTLKVVLYSNTPFFLFLWVNDILSFAKAGLWDVFVLIVLVFWVLYLQRIGLKTLQNMAGWKLEVANILAVLPILFMWTLGFQNLVMLLT